MCNLITHSLALLNMKTLSENSKFTTFDLSNVSLNQSIKIMKKMLTNFLDDLIDSRFLFNRSKSQIRLIEGNSRLVEKLKRFITKSQVDLIDSQFLFDRSIEGNSRLIETCETEFSRIFTKLFSMVLHEQTTIIWT